MMRWLFQLVLFGLFNIGSCLAEEHIKIGVIAPLSGNLANYGTTVRNAIDKVKIPGVRYIFEDEACDPAKSLQSYRKLTEIDDVSFIIGPCCGSPQKTLAAVIGRQGRDVLVMLPNAAPESVFADSNSKVFSAQYSVESEARFLAEQMNKRNLKRVVILSVDSDFSRSMEKGFIKHFKGNVVYVDHFASYDFQLMKAAVLKLKNLDFDGIFFADISPLLLGMRTEMVKMGVPLKPTFSNYGTQMPDILSAEGPQANGILYAYPDVPDEVDAIGYFPSVAARILGETVSECHGRYLCVKDRFLKDTRFNEQGVYQGSMILKTIKNGKYIRVEQ